VHEVAAAGATDSATTSRSGSTGALRVPPAQRDRGGTWDQIAYDLRHAGQLAAAGVRVDHAGLLGEQRRLAAEPDDALVEVRLKCPSAVEPQVNDEGNALCAAITPPAMNVSIK
jgi:hypothetical protein